MVRRRAIAKRQMTEDRSQRTKDSGPVFALRAATPQDAAVSRIQRTDNHGWMSARLLAASVRSDSLKIKEFERKRGMDSYLKKLIGQDQPDG